jgi:methenyltetrahydromethanopterin cyclohydrolase
MGESLRLNERALRLCDTITDNAYLLRVTEQRMDCGTRLFDFGVNAPGGIAAGRCLAEVCLAGLADVQIVSCDKELWSGPAIQVTTDQPLAACMASQYAGWEVKGREYFAMGSGPMRAAAEREPLIDEIGYGEAAPACVGVLESSLLPPDVVATDIADKCGIAADRLTLLVAPTSSQSGTVQVVARSVETALHKLHELGFDLRRVESGWGIAPLPPVAFDDLAGIGRTNDAILYGGHAVLYVRGDDTSLNEFGPRTPSCASHDHGRPFAEIFAAYHHDFYQIDRQLFSPAVVTFVNLDSGNTFRFGRFEPLVLRASFGV